MSDPSPLQNALRSLARSTQAESLSDLVGADLEAKRAIAWATLHLAESLREKTTTKPPTNDPQGNQI